MQEAPELTGIFNMHGDCAEVLVKYLVLMIGQILPAAMMVIHITKLKLLNLMEISQMPSILTEKLMDGMLVIFMAMPT
jgi:hypothetical protein